MTPLDRLGLPFAIQQQMGVTHVSGAMNTPKPDRTERNLSAVARSCHGLSCQQKVGRNTIGTLDLLSTYTNYRHDIASTFDIDILRTQAGHVHPC